MPTDAMDPAYGLADQIARLKATIVAQDKLILDLRAKLGTCNEEVRRLKAGKPSRGRWPW